MKKIMCLILLAIFTICPVSFAGSPSPLPKDTQNFPIQAVSSILFVSNVAINSSTYTAISIPPNVFCKSIYVKTRAGASWRMGTTSSPSSYVLIDFNFSLALVKTTAGILFYARGDSTSDTLEIIFMD